MWTAIGQSAGGREHLLTEDVLFLVGLVLNCGPLLEQYILEGASVALGFRSIAAELGEDIRSRWYIDSAVALGIVLLPLAS